MVRVTVKDTMRDDGHYTDYRFSPIAIISPFANRSARFIPFRLA